MVNPPLMAHDSIAAFERAETPECTDGREDYVWFRELAANVAQAHSGALVRDFDRKGFASRKRGLIKVIEWVFVPILRDVWNVGWVIPPAASARTAAVSACSSRPSRRWAPRRSHCDARRHRRVGTLRSRSAHPELLHRRPELPLALRVTGDSSVRESPRGRGDPKAGRAGHAIVTRVGGAQSRHGQFRPDAAVQPARMTPPRRKATDRLDGLAQASMRRAHRCARCSRPGAINYRRPDPVTGRDSRGYSSGCSGRRDVQEPVSSPFGYG